MVRLMKSRILDSMSIGRNVQNMRTFLGYFCEEQNSIFANGTSAKYTVRFARVLIEVMEKVSEVDNFG